MAERRMMENDNIFKLLRSGTGTGPHLQRAHPLRWPASPPCQVVGKQECTRTVTLSAVLRTKFLVVICKILSLLLTDQWSSSYAPFFFLFLRAVSAVLTP